MRKQLLVTMVLVLLVTGLVVQNYELAYGHRWSSWHWDKSDIKVLISSCQPESEAARADWSGKTDLYLPPVNYHTDISVFCGNEGGADNTIADAATREFESFCHQVQIQVICQW